MSILRLKEALKLSQNPQQLRAIDRFEARSILLTNMLHSALVEIVLLMVAWIIYFLKNASIKCSFVSIMRPDLLRHISLHFPCDVICFKFLP